MHPAPGKKLVGIEPQPVLGKMVSICWMLHNFCNNRCSYCQPYNYNGSEKWLDKNKVMAFIEKIEQHYAHCDTKFLSFTGGEPTAWKDFEEIVDRLNAANFLLGFTSNGSRDLSFWKRIGPKLNWLILSYHPEFPRDEQIAKIFQELDGAPNLALRLMMHHEPEMWDRSLKMLECIQSLTINGQVFVEYVPIQDNFGEASKPTEKYSQEQRDFFKTHSNVNLGQMKFSRASEKNIWNIDELYSDRTKRTIICNDLVTNSQVNFQGWECHIGKESLFIDHQGNIFRAGCQQGGKLGHIFDENLKLSDQPIICGKNFCPCGTDIMIRKYSPDFKKYF